jgi:hypothetical protein
MARRWLVAAVALLALGGCGDEPAAEPATVPVPATSSADPVPSRAAGVASRTAAAHAATAPTRAAPNVEEKFPAGPAGFVAVVRREMPDVALDHRDEEIAAIAEQACAALAAGRPADAVVAAVRTYGTDQATARELVKLAIDTVCPEQDRRVDEF